MIHRYTVARHKLARRAGEKFGAGPTLTAFHRAGAGSRGMSLPRTDGGLVRGPACRHIDSGTVRGIMTP